MSEYYKHVKKVMENCINPKQQKMRIKTDDYGAKLPYKQIWPKFVCFRVPNDGELATRFLPLNPFDLFYLGL